MTRNERRLKAIEQEMTRYSTEIQETWKKAEEEDRETTPEERGEVEAKMKSIETLKVEKEEVEAAIKVEADVKALSGQMGAAESAVTKEPAQPKRAKSLGDQFIESKGYQRVKDAGFGGRWATGMIDLDVEGKTLLVEGDNTFLEGGSPGAGAALVPIDQRAGIQPVLFQRLTVASLIAGGSTNSNAINYIVETLADNGAGIVAEGEAKPESALEFEPVQEAVKKIATWLPVSDEMLEDAPALRSYINARLTLFVQIKEEEELLHGQGGGNFFGLLPRVPAANKYVASDTDAPNAADHIYEAITVARRSFLEPDGVIIHPDDWADLRLLKDQNENYIGGSPFSTTGNGEPTDTLWNKRVVVTEAMIPGAALVGAFASGAQFFRRGGLTVEASNSHDDYFVSNKTAIRAEERGALAVYRPEAFALADLGYAS